MFDGPTTNQATLTASELGNISLDAINSPIENAGFVDSNAAYQRLKKDAMEKMLKSAPKHMRALIQTGGW